MGNELAAIAARPLEIAAAIMRCSICDDMPELVLSCTQGILGEPQIPLDMEATANAN